MYKTILVPHAGTPAGDEALKHAIHAAKDTSARIIILHIVEKISHPPSFALSSSEREKLVKSIDDANESIREEMKVEMKTRSQQCKDNGIESEIKVAIGNAAEIILDTVEKEKVDLIVMSKRRKLKGMKKLLSLGSVSRKVVENVTCPVTLIDIENI
ncbi:MAG: universal stress protein [Nitrosopumilus sp.]|nr:universal stress protein [Nitrosopumilus sp.]MDH3854612.1 universal stress protein [Nitrosopumilus sp.]